ncbi:unnamed protein product [Adineta ricciae]|uniref:Uncharacterized protein n=1 Tax=Adineta ricciae TaxID=249248 RepID=A0A814F6N1_ADIRI|nr:unnamed protein product [Adineta ricciae]
MYTECQSTNGRSNGPYVSITNPPVDYFTIVHIPLKTKYKLDVALYKTRYNLLMLIIMKIILLILYFGADVFHKKDKIYEYNVLSWSTAAVCLSLFHLLIYLLFVIKYNRVGIITCRLITIIHLICIFLRITVLVTQSESISNLSRLLSQHVSIIGDAFLYTILTIISFICSMKLIRLMANHAKGIDLSIQYCAY